MKKEFDEDTNSIDLTGLAIDVFILQGRNLVPKDKSYGLIGKKKTSDPYVKVFWGGKTQARTKTIRKTLWPEWNETFHIKVGAEKANEYTREYSLRQLELQLFDQDKNTSDDGMGCVMIQLPLLDAGEKEGDSEPRWYRVEAGLKGEKHYCSNATGEIQVKVVVSARRTLSLHRGNVRNIARGTELRVGLGWDMEDNNRAIDLDTSCVAVDRKGNILMDETVYFGKLVNSNGSVRHTGDEREGDEDLDGTGDDEVILCNLDQIPNNVLALFFLITVATPNKSFQNVRSARAMVTDSRTDLGIFHCRIYTPSCDGTALFLMRLSRTPTHSWVASIIQDTDHTARDFGTLIPEIKGYCRDIVPGIKINMSERIAVLRKEGAVRLKDYAPDQQLPSLLNFGLAWDMSYIRGFKKSIDLDASAIMMDANYNLLDIVFFSKLRSNDGSIVHCGDERHGDAEGYDERISIQLRRVNPSVRNVGIIINSYSGQKLDNVKRAHCALYDPMTKRTIAQYSLSNAKALDGYTALLVACMYRDDSYSADWYLRIISKPAMGKMAKRNVPDLADYLRSVSHVTDSTTADHNEKEVDLQRMPAYIPVIKGGAVDIGADHSLDFKITPLDDTMSITRGSPAKPPKRRSNFLRRSTTMS